MRSPGGEEPASVRRGLGFSQVCMGSQRAPQLLLARSWVAAGESSFTTMQASCSFYTVYPCHRAGHHGRLSRFSLLDFDRCFCSSAVRRPGRTRCIRSMVISLSCLSNNPQCALYNALFEHIGSAICSAVSCHHWPSPALDRQRVPFSQKCVCCDAARTSTVTEQR